MTTPHIIIRRLAESIHITPQTDIEVVRLVEAVRAMGEQVETVGDPDAPDDLPDLPEGVIVRRLVTEWEAQA